jgi:hypothetical protein
MTDYKALCADLHAAFNTYAVCEEHHELLQRTRTAIAQPEPEGPSDEELLALMPETMRDEFSYAAKVCSDVTGGQVKPGIFRVALNTAALEYAQAVLARWGNL